MSPPVVLYNRDFSSYATTTGEHYLATMSSLGLGGSSALCLDTRVILVTDLYSFVYYPHVFVCS